jgi:hypothetical protein
MPTMNNIGTAIGGAIALVAVIGATVAVCLGHITASDFQGIIGVALGAGVGLGAHAAGVKQGTP